MEMTNKDICRSYQKSENKADQIQILSDLNEVSRKNIIEILLDSGETVRILVCGKQWSQIKEMTDKKYVTLLKRQIYKLDEKIKEMEEFKKEIFTVLEGTLKKIR